MKKFRSSQTSISRNSYTDLSKTQFFPVTIIKAYLVPCTFVGVSIIKKLSKTYL